ncbi:hypothetical protein [Aliamphritea spongicola]|uniref:hypothetical protein n=1 Tax=Aliamphritea spongicola TaxID=707589 RepID=UPI00196B7697|nr:hypothetical protein [Aliamphritea spongicola]MBN3562241.1 hypothetical protein [Aliamphritea spongicola]
MNVGSIGNAVVEFFGGEPARPQPKDIAADLATRVERGEIDATKFAERLEGRYGDRAVGIVREDGSVDVKGLSALLESSAPAPRRQPGTVPASTVPAGQETLQTQLINEFGNDAAAKVFDADGKVDFGALVDLVKDAPPARSGPGYLNEKV